MSLLSALVVYNRLHLIFLVRLSVLSALVVYNLNLKRIHLILILQQFFKIIQNYFPIIFRMLFGFFILNVILCNLEMSFTAFLAKAIGNVRVVFRFVFLAGERAPVII